MLGKLPELWCAACGAVADGAVAPGCAGSNVRMSFEVKTESASRPASSASVVSEVTDAVTSAVASVSVIGALSDIDPRAGLVNMSRSGVGCGRSTQSEPPRAGVEGHLGGVERGADRPVRGQRPHRPAAHGGTRPDQPPVLSPLHRRLHVVGGGDHRYGPLRRDPA